MGAELTVRSIPTTTTGAVLEKGKSVAQDIGRYLDDKSFPKESVYR